MNNPKEFIKSVRIKIAVTHLLVGLAGVGFLIFLGKVLDGYLAGFALGGVNMLAALWIAARGLDVVEANPDNIQSFAVSRYFLKFFLLIGSTAFVLKVMDVEPVGVLIGFSASLVISVAVLFIELKSEIKKELKNGDKKN